MDRATMADFLRRHREALRPADVGIPVTARRRTPGLRREDVAALAMMSTDYYTRLEQQRGPQPSEQMLGSLARALRLASRERRYLFQLAGAAASRSVARPARPAAAADERRARLPVPAGRAHRPRPRRGLNARPARAAAGARPARPPSRPFLVVSLRHPGADPDGGRGARRPVRLHGAGQERDLPVVHRPRRASPLPGA